MIRTIFTFILATTPAILFAQCMHADFGLEQAAINASRIVEAEVVSQHSFIADDGNIRTVHTLDIFKEIGQPVFGDQVAVLSDGGIVGDMAQVVYPSISMNVGQIVLCFLDHEGSAIKKLIYDKTSASYFTSEGRIDADHVYEHIGDAIGNHLIGFRRMLPAQTVDSRVTPPQIASVYPSEISAGTLEEIVISGIGFGSTQGTGTVSFSNADDGGQSQIVVPAGPHYLSWTDTEIRMYVPSSMLFANVVAGSGLLQVTNDLGGNTFNSNPVSISYAKGEVIYQGALGGADLVDRTNGGYEFVIGNTLQNIAGASDLAQVALNKWACNTGANFVLNAQESATDQYEVDGFNVIGMAAPGELPSYVLGKTVTTFSACGGGNEISWQLLEMDLLFNPTVNWHVGEGTPTQDEYDLLSVMLHELGHAHLMQHNNNQNSVMYFELNIGDSNRFIDADSDVYGGLEIVDHSVNYGYCGSDPLQYFNDLDCDLGVLNSMEESNAETLSIYPNPSKGMITVRSEREITQINVLDAAGRLIITENTVGIQTQLDLSDLPNGVYQLQIRSETETTVKQVVLF